MRNQKLFTFREIEEVNELEKFMKLRYQTYYNSSKRNFLQISDHKIDLEIYDLHARHFGLFCNDEPAGYIRVVVHKDEIYNHNVFSIGKKYSFFNENKHSETALKQFEYPDFPFISYLEIPKSVKHYYENLREKREGLAEAGRIMLIGEMKGLSNARFLIECAVVLYLSICIGKKHAVINCDSSHKRFYKQYGFETINKSDTYYLRGRTKKSSHLLSLPLSMSLSSSPIPKNHHQNFEEMANEFLKTKQIIRTM